MIVQVLPKGQVHFFPSFLPSFILYALCCGFCYMPIFEFHFSSQELFVHTRHALRVYTIFSFCSYSDQVTSSKNPTDKLHGRNTKLQV